MRIDGSNNPPSRPIEEALRAAGAALPTRLEAVWRWLKDHPNSNSKTVAHGLRLGHHTVGSTLSSLERRRQVRGVWVDMKTVSKMKETGALKVQVRKVKHYSTIGDRYEPTLEVAPLTARKVKPKVPARVTLHEEIAHEMASNFPARPAAAPERSIFDPNTYLNAEPIKQAIELTLEQRAAELVETLSVVEAYAVWTLLGKMFH